MRPLPMTATRTPPHDFDAEQSVLGAMLLSRDAIAVALEHCRTEDFYKPAHGHVFEAISSLYGEGEPVDPVTVADELRRAGLLDVIGGPNLLIDLLASTPSTANAGRYAKIVADHALLRKLIGAGNEIADKGYELGEVDEVIAKAEGLLSSATAGRNNGPRQLNVRRVGDALFQPPEEPPVLVDGLIRTGELCVVGAARGVGKSWLGMNLSAQVDRGDGWFMGALPIRKKATVLLCQGEIDEWESWRRWQMLTGTGDPPGGVLETFDRWRIRTVRRRSSNGASSDEYAEALLDPRLEATIVEQGVDLLIIDPWAVFFAGPENDNDATEAALDKLRALAMSHAVAVVILHHLGKSTEAREPEDLWRGASRLADWAATRVTLLPHYTDRQASAQGMTRQQARRYVDVKLLRRSHPTPDFSAVLGDDGWWSRWKPPGEDTAGRTHLGIDDVIAACRDAGGAWPSGTQAAASMGVAAHTATKLLQAAERRGEIEHFPGPRGAIGWRLPGPKLTVVGNPGESI